MDDNYNIITETLHFEWSPEKRDINIKKHGIDFHEAASVFDDESAVVFDDPDHSYEEERFGIIGISSVGNVCLVIYCIRGEDERVRIISARSATKREESAYINFNNRGGL